MKESQGKPGEMSYIAAKYLKLRGAEQSGRRMARLLALIEFVVAVERFAWKKHFASILVLLPLVLIVVIFKFLTEGMNTLLKHVDRKDYYG